MGALTCRMTEGDEQAYRTFYDAYYPRLWRYLVVITEGNEDAATEALQSTLLRVVRYVKIFPDEASFWGWLTLLARTALSDQRRGLRRYLAFLDRFTRHTRVQDPFPTRLEGDAVLVSLLERNLSQLAAEERSLIEAKYFDGRSVRDIAHAFGTSEKAIESQLSRLRRKLKAGLLAGLSNERFSE